MKPANRWISVVSLTWLANCGGASADSSHTVSHPDARGNGGMVRAEPEAEPEPYVAVSDPPDRPTPSWVIERPVPQGPYQVEIVSGEYRSLPTFYQGGRTYVLGAIGERYRIRIANPTGRRVEAVVSVDGLDAVDGRTASYDKRGYLVPPWGEVTIDGFRTSIDEVATFRFSSVGDSYAGRKGQDRNVGVIGVAFFPERYVPPPPPRRPRPLETWRGRSWDGAPAESKAGAAPAPEATGRMDRDEARRSEGDRPGLGTEFGEQRESRVRYTEFQRESASRPAVVYEVRYNDRHGLIALGVPVDGPYPTYRDTRLRETADPFPQSRFAEPPPPRY